MGCSGPRPDRPAMAHCRTSVRQVFVLRARADAVCATQVRPVYKVRSVDQAQRSRYVDLIRLLVRYGRSDLVAGAGGDEFLTEDAEPVLDEEGPNQLVEDLERMGPTYIKLGQLLSTRVDLLPAPYTEALTRLQDEVEPFPVAQVREIIEAELGAPVRSLFSEFDVTPPGRGLAGAGSSGRYAQRPRRCRQG